MFLWSIESLLVNVRIDRDSMHENSRPFAFMITIEADRSLCICMLFSRRLVASLSSFVDLFLMHICKVVDRFSSWLVTLKGYS